MSDLIRVIIADKLTLVREAIERQLNALPDIEVVASVGSGREAVARTHDLQLDVVILDLDMAEHESLQSARIIFEDIPTTKVLFLTNESDANAFFRSVGAGISGYLVRVAGFDDFVAAIRSLASGQDYIWAALNGAILDHLRSTVPFDPNDMGYSQLSEREREVLKLIAEGQSVRTIAERLVVTPSTVQTHRTHVLEKLRLQSTVDLVRYAIRLGLIEP